jgi:hypothetical protein
MMRDVREADVVSDGGSDGFTSTDVTHVSSFKFPGMTNQVHSTMPFAGTS